MACIPSYFLLYGTYRRVSIPEQPPYFTDWFDQCNGDPPIDFEADLIHERDLPKWDNLEQAGARNLGQIKMKRVNFERWCANVHQTAVWFGTAMPSINSELRQGKADAKKGKGASNDKLRSHGKKAANGKGSGKL